MKPEKKTTFKRNDFLSPLRPLPEQD